VAIALGVVCLSRAAHAQSIALPCDEFIKNPDGSWTAKRDVPVYGLGRKLTLRQGGTLAPGAAILSVDFAALLEQQCPSIAVTVPGSEPELAPAMAPALEPAVKLSKYADANGNVDVQKLTCGQFSDTSQGEADFLGALYIGWYNGLAKKNAINLTRGKDAIRNLIVYCKANKDKRVTQAIDFIRRDERR
jgi:HdeA/HdeB family